MAKLKIIDQKIKELKHNSASMLCRSNLKKPPRTEEMKITQEEN